MKTRRIHRAPEERPVFKCRYPGCEGGRLYGRTQDRGRHELFAHGMRNGVVPGPVMSKPEARMKALEALMQQSAPAPTVTFGGFKPGFLSDVETNSLLAVIDEDLKDRQADRQAHEITAARIQDLITHLESRLQGLHDALIVIRDLK